MKIAAVVPAKGTSERVKNKNLRTLGGEYLVKRKLKQLLESRKIDEVWLDTDSDEIISVCNDLPIKIMKRDPSLATNKTDGHEMFANEAASIEADILVQALCTAPFLEVDIIDDAIEHLIASDRNSLIAVEKTKQYTWTENEPDYGWGRIPNSVDLPDIIIESMTLYCVKNPKINSSQRFTKDVVLYETPQLANIDLNNESDFDLARSILAGQRADEQNYFKILKSHLNSAVLSDLTKDMGLSCMLPRDITCKTEGKILGRAKTLSIRSLEKTDSPDEWKGIYKALDSYSFMENGDVIVVSNENQERAYFGDLNAHLALRSGCVGVIVDGLTRDTAAVKNMALPVYAKGVWSNDIKYEGTLRSMNRTIEIGGVMVSNGDVIYADAEGALVLPSKEWPYILKSALKVVGQESQIRESIINGEKVGSVIQKHGFF